METKGPTPPPVEVCEVEVRWVPEERRWSQYTGHWVAIVRGRDGLIGEGATQQEAIANAVWLWDYFNDQLVRYGRDQVPTRPMATCRPPRANEDADAIVEEDEGEPFNS